jgi:protein involved in polysaccharide export with SLBB domain
MLQRRSPFALLAIVVLCVTSLTSIGPATAQGIGSSSDTSPLQMLQGLSPDQRDQIMNQLGIGSGSSSSGGLGGLGGGNSGGLGGVGTQTMPGRQRPTEEMEEQEADARTREQQQRQFDEERELLSPFLKGDDWIIITIDAYPPQGNQPGQGLQQQGGAGSSIPGLSGAGTSSLPPGAATAAGSLLGGLPGAAVAAGGGAAGSVPAGGGSAGAQMNGQNNPNGTSNGANGSGGDVKPELTDEEKKTRDDLIDLIRSKNPYQLTRDGMLLLPGFAPMPMAGLTEQLAMLRLGVEPSLRDLYIHVTKLPLKKLGVAALKPFGYDLFDQRLSTFAPATNVPVPADYVIGAGDELDVLLYGTQNRNLQLFVGRDGRVQVPELGPVSVAGQTFNAVKATIEAQVERQMIGTRASVSMGDTREIRVFVLGEAKRPGSYTVSGLATITSALFAAGGVRTEGSLRNIELKRQGTLVRRLDLYDMLIRGNTVDDAKLLPGDVIFIPPVGPTIGVDGEVRRPAIYETRGETNLAEVLDLAGGLSPEADLANAALTRIDSAQHRVVLRVDLSGGGAKAQPARNGDLLRISRLRPSLDAGVLVEGYVYATGAFAYHAGMRLSDAIHTVDDLKPNADIHYLLIRRELPPDRRVVVLSADLGAALQAPGSAADVPLMARDRIMVFDLQSSRDRVIQPLLEELKLQSNILRPKEVVRIEGHAKVPGEYPLETGMTVRDLVRAGGSLTDAAYGGQAELTRYSVVNGETRRTELVQIDLAAALRGDPTNNLRLEPFDILSIKQVQLWDKPAEINLRGEIRFAGKYTIKPGETLKSVMQRAGGLTDYAFADGAVFTRKELRDREQKQLDMLAAHMQNDITFVALEGAASNQSQAGTSLQVGQSLLTQLKATKAVGRLVINLTATMREPMNSVSDVILRDGDELLVPKMQQEVTVIGEVQNVTSHLYKPNLTRDNYIAMSGGVTRRADTGRIYVVRANGSVVISDSGRWYSSSSVQIRPGDTIVVPLNAEHIPLLPLWQAVTQIIYNVAIAAAAVHSF